MENKKLYDSLINLLMMFKNRPHHLAKYLIDNKSLSKSFIKKISSSNIEDKNFDNIIFEDISHLNDYFNSLFDNEKKNQEELKEELNKKMDKLLSEEKYEEAILLRDYMTKNNIKRNI